MTCSVVRLGYLPVWDSTEEAFWVHVAESIFLLLTDELMFFMHTSLEKRSGYESCKNLCGSKVATG